jgi:hypothetical protein
MSRHPHVVTKNLDPNGNGATDDVALTGGTIDDVVIGGTTAANATFGDSVIVGQEIAHDGDSDTKMVFSGDSWKLDCGGAEFINCTETTQNTMVVNGDALDIDVTFNKVTSGTWISYVGGTDALTLSGATINITETAETIDSGVAASVTIRKTLIDNTTSGAGAITLAAPDATMIGVVKIIEMTVDNGDVTLALTNVQGGSAATTATFADVNDALVLIGGTNKWHVIGESGVVLS